MTHRTSFALDEGAAQRIKRLATCWNVSQAETVAEASKPDPITLLKAYHAKGGLDKARVDQWIEEIDEDRKRWRASS